MSVARDIDRICDEFEAAWQAGEVPKVEEFLERIDEEHRPALREALMPLDLTYRGKLGETLDSGAAAGPGKVDSGFEVTLDSDSGGPELLARPTTRPTKRVKYFGEYELISEIARGGMGVVYKARQVKLNRIVALKMILSGEFAGSEAVQRFHSEAESAANLDHPGIVPIYEIGEHEGQHYFSMGFIDGPSLQGKLAAGPMPAKEAARLCRKIAEAVAYAHSKNVIHRDLKPANVLIDGNGEPKVTDFGLAKKVEGDSGLTRTGAVMGTPSYMPPEQALGQTDRIGPAADIYSLGAILYCMLTGRPPFQAASVVDTLKQVIDNEPITPRTLDNKIPLDLETICLKCLEKIPSSRYTAAQEFVDELTCFDKGEPIKARRISRTARSLRWCKRNPVVAGFLALTSVLLAISVGSLIRESEQKRLAEISATKAIDAETKERSARKEVEAERDRAVKAESDTLASQEKTELTLARSNYFLAMARWDANRVYEANSLLERVPTKYRQIEWSLAKRQFRGNSVSLYGHSGSVDCVSFSPDGKRIVSCSKFVPVRNVPDAIRVWDTTSGHEVLTLQGSNWANDVTYSPDGSQIVSAGPSRSINIWDAESGTLLATLEGHTSEVNCVRFSPSGETIASGAGMNAQGRLGEIKLWDATSGTEIRTFDGHERGIQNLDISPDGSKIVSVAQRLSGGVELKLWDVSNGDELWTQSDSSFSVNAVSFSPDGTKLATAGHDKMIKFWETESGDQVRTLKGHSIDINCIKFSPDGTHIISAAGSRNDPLGTGEIKLWNATTGEELRNFAGHTGQVYSVCFNPSGTSVVSGGNDATIRLWSAVESSEKDECMTLGSHEGQILDVAYNPNGLQIASASDDTTITLWDATNGNKFKTLQHSYPVSRVCYSPNGSRIISAAGKEHDSRDAGEITMWDSITGNQIWRFRDTKNEITSVCFSPDGSQIISVGNDNSTKLWDASSGELLTTLSGEVRTSAFVSFNPDGLRLMSLENVGRFGLTDVSTGQKLITLKRPPAARGLLRIAYSHDGTTLATAGNDGRVELWDVASGDAILTLQGHTSFVGGVAFSPDGLRVVTSSGDETIKLWDATSGDDLRTIRGHSFTVTSVCFSPDGKQIISGSRDHTVKIWNNGDLNDEFRTLVGHTAPVVEVVFSTSGKQIASHSADGTARLWDTLSGHLLASPEGYVIGYSPDRTRLATVTIDAEGTGRSLTTTIWDFATGSKLSELSGYFTGFSVDGSKVATIINAGVQRDDSIGIDKGAIKVWDAQNGSEIVDIGTFETKHRSVSGDKTRIVARTDPKTIKLWDIGSANKPMEIVCENGEVRGVGFSSDGKYFGFETTENANFFFSVQTGEPVDSNEFREAEESFKTKGVETSRNRSPDGRWFAIPLVDQIRLIDLEYIERPEVKVRLKIASGPFPSWHQEQAVIAQKSSDWFAATFHLAWLLKVYPNSTDDVSKLETFNQLRKTFELLSTEERPMLLELVKAAIDQFKNSAKDGGNGTGAE